MKDQDIIHSNKALLEGLARHDERALQGLYSEYFPMIRRMVLLNQGDEDDAKDLFQESLMVLYEKSKDPAFILECKPKTYLYAVGHRLWLKHLHRQQRHPVIPVKDEEALEGPTVSEDLKEHEIREARFEVMEGALGRLGEPCKSLLEDFYIHRCSMLEIAEKFGYTNPDNAKTQKYKCLNRLKKLFFDQYKDR